MEPLPGKQDRSAALFYPKAFLLGFSLLATTPKRAAAVTLLRFIKVTPLFPPMWKDIPLSIPILLIAPASFLIVKTLPLVLWLTRKFMKGQWWEEVGTLLIASPLSSPWWEAVRWDPDPPVENCRTKVRSLPTPLLPPPPRLCTICRTSRSDLH